MPDPVGCPACGGLSQPGHKLGWLEGWHHALTCPLLGHEDGMAVTDRDHYPWVTSRPATDTERALLAALGYTVPVVLTTVLAIVPPGVRARTWPELEPPKPT